MKVAVVKWNCNMLPHLAMAAPKAIYLDSGELSTLMILFREACDYNKLRGGGHEK